MIDREEVDVDALVEDIRVRVRNSPTYFAAEEVQDLAGRVVDALETLSLDLHVARERANKLREERGSEVNVDWVEVAKKRDSLVQALSECEAQSPEWWYFSGLIQGFDRFRGQVRG